MTTSHLTSVFYNISVTHGSVYVLSESFVALKKRVWLKLQV